MSLLRDVRGLPREAWILTAGSFVNRFGAFVITFLVLYLRDLGYSEAQSAAVVSAYGVGHLGASALGGALADRIGRRATIVTSMVSSAATMLALSQVRGLVLIVVFTALAGLTAELYRPASAALLGDVVPEADRVPAFALYRLGINLGFAAGPATAGFLAQRSFLLLFIGDAITSLIYAAVAYTLLPRRDRPARQVAERRGEALRAALADPPFLRFVLATLLAALVFFQFTTTLPLHVRDVGLSDTDYGILISLNGLLIVLIELPITAVTRRLPPRRVIAFGIVLVGVGFGLTGAATSFLALAATVVLWTLGEIVNAPVSGAYVVGMAPPHLRGRYQGIYGLAFGVALIAAPSLGGLLYATRPTLLWTLCSAVSGVAALLVLTGRRVPAIAPPLP